MGTMTDIPALIERLDAITLIDADNVHEVFDAIREAASALASQQERIAEQSATIAELRRALKDLADAYGTAWDDPKPWEHAVALLAKVEGERK